MDFRRHLQRHFAKVLLGGLTISTGFGAGVRFYPDDPVAHAPQPRPAGDLPERKTDALFDFVYQSFSPPAVKTGPSLGVNTMGEVLDSEWFTNRHARHRMSIEELKRGPVTQEPPQPPFTVVGAKTDGITPGFRMKDGRGRLFFVKPDPVTNPEMATAADVIGSKFFYAIGYNTPENYLFFASPEELKLGKEATVTGASGRKRSMSQRDLNSVLRKAPRRKDGKIRFMGSLAVPGKPIGPFRYTGTRSDDPNDYIPHEQRRDLRGLAVICAWLNHTDAKSVNSLDSLVEDSGVKYVRHFLIDFGAILGSDSDMPKNARFGNAYIIPETGPALRDMADLGLGVTEWEKAKYPKMREVGRFESKIFDPEKWVPNYPNPAFLQRQPGDEYWGAKQVMAFTDQDIRAIVETGEYQDPQATEYVTATLKARRDKIGRAYFEKVFPLEDFQVEGGGLRFTDLAVKYGFAPKRSYDVQWSSYDNQTQQSTPMLGAAGAVIPASWSADGSYAAARISLPSAPAKGVTVYLRRRGGTVQVVGIDR